MEHVKRIGRDLVYQGTILDFYEDKIQTPNGKVVTWDFIGHKGAAAVVPVKEDGKLVLVRQYRNALDRETLEIPAGARNYPKEPTRLCASRELEEETGFRSENLELLLTLRTAIAYCNELIDVYVARDLIPSKQHLDEDEFVEVEEYTLDELCHMIYEGKLQDAKTVAAIMAYKAKFQL